MPKNGKRYNGRSVNKRLKKLEVKSKLQEKTTEFKQFYYHASVNLDSTWGSNSGMVPRLTAGVYDGGAPASSTTAEARIGDSITMVQLMGNLQARLSTAGTGAQALALQTANCRIIICDNLQGDEGLDAADVLADSSTAAQSMVSFYRTNIDPAKKYKIHADYKFTLNEKTPVKRIKFRMKVPKTGRVLDFNGGAASAPSNFNLSMLYFSDIGPLEAEIPILDYNWKIKYIDA